MTYHHTHDSEKGLFTARQDTQQAGEISYFQQDDHTLVIDHTGVDEAFRGGEVGRTLVQKVADYARTQNQKVVPRCSYARHVFESDAALKDVWQQGE